MVFSPPAKLENTEITRLLAVRKAKGRDEMWYVIQTKTGQEEPMRQQVEKILPDNSYEDCKILYYVKRKNIWAYGTKKEKDFCPDICFWSRKIRNLFLKRLTESLNLQGFLGLEVHFVQSGRRRKTSC